MKAIWTILASAAALCAAADDVETAVSSKYLHVPLVMWSERPLFAKQGAYSNAVLDEAQVAKTLESVLSDDTTEALLNSEAPTEKAEVLALFLSPKLDAKSLSQFSTDGTSFVEKAVQESTSSVVVPHTTREGDLEAALKEAALTAPVVTDVEAWVASAEGKALLADGKTDLVVVKIPEDYTLPQADAFIQSAAATLSKATESKVDFALTGNEADTIVSQVTRTRRLAAAATTTIQCDAGYLVGTDYKGMQYCFAHYVRMTPNLLSGIVVGGFFVFLGYIGISAMHGIQTPAKYPHHGPPKGKEF